MPQTLSQPTNIDQKRHPTILSIDDDPEISCAIGMILSRYEVEVVQAYTGQQGIWQTLCKCPDLVITDLRMPQGGGDVVLECLKSLRKTWCVPVIVLTGIRDQQLAFRMRRLGAAGFLQKPVSTPLLLAEIKKHVVLREREPSQRKTWNPVPGSRGPERSEGPEGDVPDEPSSGARNG